MADLLYLEQDSDGMFRIAGQEQLPGEPGESPQHSVIKSNLGRDRDPAMATVQAYVFTDIFYVVTVQNQPATFWTKAARGIRAQKLYLPLRRHGRELPREEQLRIYEEAHRKLDAEAAEASTRAVFAG